MSVVKISEEQLLVTEEARKPEESTIIELTELKAGRKGKLSEFRVLKTGDKVIVEEPEKTFSWAVNWENEEGWNEHLLKYKRRWAYAAAVVAAPGLLIFLVPFFARIATGKWFSVSTSGWTSKTVKFYNETTLPNILNQHMWLALFMLVGLITQAILAICVAAKSSVPGDCQHKAHRWCGRFTAMVVMICTFTGTVALAFCDVGPKRGIESVTFVYVGVKIMILCYKAVNFAARKQFGLHMQYMFMLMFWVTSPGWNRITALLLRAVSGGQRAFNDPRYMECQRIPDAAGYYYTWSFILGFLWFIGVWAASGVPFVKRYSPGFWLFVTSAVMTIICAWDMGVNASALGLGTSGDCTDAELEHAHQYYTALDNHGRYSPYFSLGLCHAVDAPLLKIPLFYASNSTKYIYGY